MNEYVKKQQELSETIDENLDKLSRLPGEFYELRNALNKVGLTDLAKQMDEFASLVNSPTTSIRWAFHEYKKNYLKNLEETNMKLRLIQEMMNRDG